VTAAHAAASELISGALGKADTPDAVRSIAIPAVAESPALVVHVIPMRREARDIFSASLR
jgi:hypothetical protein